MDSQRSNPLWNTRGGGEAARKRTGTSRVEASAFRDRSQKYGAIPVQSGVHRGTRDEKKTGVTNRLREQNPNTRSLDSPPAASTDMYVRFDRKSNPMTLLSEETLFICLREDVVEFIEVGQPSFTKLPQNLGPIFNLVVDLPSFPWWYSSFRSYGLFQQSSIHIAGEIKAVCG